MRKIDFTKIEKDLEDMMRNMSVKEWLQLAALSNLIGGISVQKIENKEEEATKQAKRDMVIENIIISFNQDLDFIQQNDPSLYKSFTIKAAERKRYANPSELSAIDWEKIRDIREKIGEYKLQFRKEMPGKDDDKLVENERKKHLNKRFNVRESWLPVD